LGVGSYIQIHKEIPSSGIAIFDGSGGYQFDWLTSYLFSVIESLGGALALSITKYVSVFIFCVSVGILFSKEANDVFVGALIACLAAAGVLYAPELSSVLFGYIGYAYIVALSFREDCQKKALLITWGLPILCVMLFSNLALSTFVACAIAIVFAKGLRKVVFILPLFVSPYFGAHILPAYKAILTTAVNAIMYQFSAGTVYMYPVAILVMLSVIFLNFWLSSRVTLSIKEALFYFLPLLLALSWSALVPYAIIHIGFGVARLWNHRQANSSKFVTAVEVVKNKIADFPLSGPVILFSALAFVSIKANLRDTYDLSLMPEAAIDFLLLQEEPKGRLFHFPEIAGYLIYRGQLSLIQPMFSRTVESTTEALKVKRIKDLRFGWEQDLNSYDAGTLLLRRMDKLYNVLEAHSEYGKEYEKVYEDSQAKANAPFGWVVFARKTQAEH
jgi:hypothetical protein